MSSFGANLLTNLAGTGSPAFTGGELSRARFNLNGTGTIAERGSFNIASYVDNGVGEYTANFTTAFPNANYSGSAGAELFNATSQPVIAGPRTQSDRTTTAKRIITKLTNTFASVDADTAVVTVIGDRP